SLFTAATGASFNALSLTITRLFFGIGEAAAFPASSRAVVRWLPLHQRAFGQGAQHAGSRLGAALAPAIVVFLMFRISWRSVFYIFGAVGAVWSVIWFWYYRNRPEDHPDVNEQELKLVGQADSLPKLRAGYQPAPQVPWRRILRSRDLWFLSGMYF